MSWQDIVFGVGSILFILALIPTIRSGEKPAPTTSAATATILFFFGIAYMSLDLWFAAATSYLTSLTWAFILYKTEGKRLGQDG